MKKNGYNESEGGDGGSQKGHCQGSKNGRALLAENDIIFIRTKFKEGCSRQECYELFKEEFNTFEFRKFRLNGCFCEDAKETCKDKFLLFGWWVLWFNTEASAAIRGTVK